MTDTEFSTLCSTHVLKIIDAQHQLSRQELEEAVKNIVKHIIAEAKAKARLDSNHNG